MMARRLNSKSPRAPRPCSPRTYSPSNSLHKNTQRAGRFGVPPVFVFSFHCPAAELEPNMETRLAQRLFQVFNQVLFIFQTHGNTHRSRTDAGAAQLFIRHVVVRAVDWKDNERLDPAEPGCQQKEAPAVAEAPRRRQTAFQVKREHAPESAHLLLRDLVIRVRRKTRVVHAGDLRMPFHVFRDGYRVLALARDAHAESLDTADEKIRHAGIHRATKINDHMPDAVHPL